MKERVAVDDEVLIWLLDGDVAIQFQVYRDLLGEHRPDLRARIANEGWGAAFLARQNADGHWGRGFYQPKWISSHYTLLDLMHLHLSPNHPAPQRAIDRILTENLGADGGVNPGKTIPQSDVCVNGMFLNYACYFGTYQEVLRVIIDFIIDQWMPDGGFNCRSNRSGAVHSSLHSTISVLEGLLEYECGGYTYRLDELRRIALQAQEFILQHRLFRSDHTGEVIDKRFLLLSYPPRWYYDVLRALDYFRAAGTPYDPRMADAFEILVNKRRSDGRWPLQGKHPGQTHFEMEPGGKPSRWNTLRTLRVLRYYGVEV
jgi:hypothetical protein